MSDILAIYPISNNMALTIVECNDEYVTYIDPLQKKHTSKIYVNSARAYFRCSSMGDKRIYLDECLRVQEVADMFKCKDCGAIFEEPEEIRDYRGEFWGFPAYETVSCCPCCGGDDFKTYYEWEDEEEEDEEEEEE